MNQSFKVSLGLLSMALVLPQCTPTSPLSHFEGISPTFSSFDVPIKTLSIVPNEGDTIFLANGGSIEVPANALIDAHGNTLTEKVELSFKEFHTQADILASGIPMRYDSAGGEGHMVTAGMFELRAEVASGQDVFIRSSTPVQVNLASFEAGNHYNSYALDDATGDWSYLETTAPRTNRQKAEQLTSLLAMDTLSAPVAPVAYEEGIPVLNLQPDYKRLPELKPFHGVVWQHAGQGPNVLEQEWFLATSRSAVDLERNGTDFTYSAKFISADTSVTTMLQPVFSKKDYEKAVKRFAEKEADYTANKGFIQAEKQRLEQQADLLRSIGVSSFGIYNYDRIYKQDNTIHLTAKFDWGEKANIDINKVQVFLIVESANAVVAFPPSQWKLFNFDPEESNKLMAVLPGDRIAYLSASDFAGLHLNKEKHDKQDYTFHLKVAKGGINSMKDLQGFLAQM